MSGNELGKEILDELFQTLKNKEEIKTKFEEFDKNKSGFLEKKEMIRFSFHFLKSTDSFKDKEDRREMVIKLCKDLLQGSDENEDRKISLEEFENTMVICMAKILKKSFEEEQIPVELTVEAVKEGKKNLTDPDEIRLADKLEESLKIA